MIQGILFDFDGVIMDSMGLKLDSFCHALERFMFSREDIKAVQDRYTGLSRHKILALIYEELSGQSITDSIQAELSERFTDHDERSRLEIDILSDAGPMVVIKVLENLLIEFARDGRVIIHVHIRVASNKTEPTIGEVARRCRFD